METPKRKLPRKVRAVSLLEHDYMVEALTDELQRVQGILADLVFITETGK